MASSVLTVQGCAWMHANTDKLPLRASRSGKNKTTPKFPVLYNSVKQLILRSISKSWRTLETCGQWQICSNSLWIIPRHGAVSGSCLGLILPVANNVIAEQSLRSYEGQNGFAILLLHIVASTEFPMHVRLAGAVFFKNFIKRKWTDEEGNYKLPQDDVNNLKSEIIGLMISLPQNLQAQIGEAVSIMADSDFPDRWQNLVPTLVGQLGTDAKTNNGVLTVAHSIFGRWRPLFRSDALFLEIKLVLDQFSVPFLTLLKQTDEQIQQNKDNKAVLTDLFNTMILVTKIFFDLNCQDIPEFFEDNMNTCFEVFHRYLEYSNPVLETDDDEEIGLIESVKSSICEVLELYTQRYEDEFSSLLPNFVNTTWNLLTATGQQPKYDILVSRSLAFLTAVAKIQRQVHIFEEPLEQVVRMIVLPNMALRTSDEELFEDDPIEYTRRDLEGSDSDTRRRAATDFIRELTEKMESKATQVVMTYVQGYLENYEKNKTENWRDKDAATFLYSAIAAKGNVTSAGVSATNILLDVVAFFTQHIAPDLVATDINPILKVDAIKYIHTFRNQLTKDQLKEAFPLLSSHLSSSEYVVYTYTAITIERILSIRINNNSALMFQRPDVEPYAKDLLISLFNLIMKGNKSPEKLAENEFLMKCIMRILVTIQEGMTPFGEEMLQQLVGIVNEISKNPSNPRFSHFTFESIGSIIRFCGSSIGFQKIESLIMPTCMEILQQDIQEFAPYVFQILAQLLRATPVSAGLSDSYRTLIGPLMAPTLWESRGNIPALVSLLQAILVHGGSSSIISTGSIEPLLGVFQKLIASKVSDGYGLDLLEEIFLGVPLDALEKYVQQIGVLLLQRLQNSKTDRFVARLSKFVYFLSAIENRPGLGPDFAISVFDGVQDGIFKQILIQFILPTTLKINGSHDRKIAAVGLTKILTQTQKFTTGAYVDQFVPSLDILIKLLQTEVAESLNDDTQVVLDVESEEATFGSSFSKLSTTSTRNVDPAPSVTNAVQYFIGELKRVTSSNNQLAGLLSGLGNESREYLVKHGF